MTLSVVEPNLYSINSDQPSGSETVQTTEQPKTSSKADSFGWTLRMVGKDIYEHNAKKERSEEK